MAKLYLVAGHNGAGTGANGLIDEGAESIALRDAILKEIAGRCTVLTDKNTDKLTTVIDWVKKIVGKTDLLVDIHFDAAAPEANGTGVFVPDNPTAKENEIGLKLLKVICTTFGTASRGVRTESQTAHKVIGMLRYPNCHNILIEVCFVTNKRDAAIYANAKPRLAKAIADELVSIIKTL